MLLGNRMNAALLWPHAPALGMFINPLINLCFSTLSQNVWERLLSHWLSNSDFQNEGVRRLPVWQAAMALSNNLKAQEGGGWGARGDCSYFPPTALHMKMSIERKKKRQQGEEGQREESVCFGAEACKRTVGLFCLEGQSGYWEKTEEERQRGVQDTFSKLSSPAKFHFLKGCSQSGQAGLLKGKICGWVYCKWFIHSVIHWLNAETFKIKGTLYGRLNCLNRIT